MRYFLVLGLFTGLCTSVTATTLHHSREHVEHVIVHSNHTDRLLSAYGAAGPSVDYDDTPSYNDPSKYGGGTALPVMP